MQHRIIKIRKSFFFPIYFLHLQGGKNCLPLFDFVYSFRFQKLANIHFWGIAWFKNNVYLCNPLKMR